MVLNTHLAIYRDVFNLPNFLNGPALCFGFQEIEKGVEFNGVSYASLEDVFRSFGVAATSLDFFDGRAALRYDMNLPVPSSEHGRYGTLIDIGSIEHVFDTRQCLENCIRMLAVGGNYFLVTPVNGYFGHGLHTFHPEGVLAALDLNGFRVVYVRYTKLDGTFVDDPCKPRETVIWQDPSVRDDLLIWLVAVKEREIESFTCPQQGKWVRVYPQPEPVPV